MKRLRAHWSEYLSEATCLGLFMLSAAVMATLLQHPASPLSGVIEPSWLQRLPMGIAMGLTAVALIYSPLGIKSGAHMNPAVTLTFLRLRKIAPADAAAYIVAQFVGGAAGIVLASVVLAGLPAHPSVNFVATQPGGAGIAAAFLGEAAISFVMMTLVLTMTNDARAARFTGIGAGLLIVTFIVIEAPLSGMSMNPARTLGANLLASAASTLWIYFTAPPLGMLLAAEWFVRRRSHAHVRCAKLHHLRSVRCIFHCGHMESAT
jgi:aquaporin Z